MNIYKQYDNVLVASKPKNDIKTNLFPFYCMQCFRFMSKIKLSYDTRKITTGQLNSYMHT